jgi:hypothetical protein
MGDFLSSQSNKANGDMFAAILIEAIMKSGRNLRILDENIA